MTQNNDKNPVQKVTGTGTLDHAGRPAASGKQGHSATDETDKKKDKEKRIDPARTAMYVEKDHADRKNPN